MKASNIIITTLFASVLMIALSGCEKGPTEKAGESIDNAADQAGDTLNNAANKAEDKMDKAGDAVKDAVKDDNNK